MYQKYRAIEIHPSLPVEEKIEHMKDWMVISQKNLKGLKFDHKEIDELVVKYGHSLRDRAKELFLKLKALDVPILVLSAGLGDIIEALLRHQGVLLENVHIISNFLQFNGDILEGYKNSDKMIHVFNKNEHSVENEYFRILRGRTNIILMGDSLGMHQWPMVYKIRRPFLELDSCTTM